MNSKFCVFLFVSLLFPLLSFSKIEVIGKLPAGPRAIAKLLRMPKEYRLSESDFAGKNWKELSRLRRQKIQKLINSKSSDERFYGHHLKWISSIIDVYLSRVDNPQYDLGKTDEVRNFTSAEAKEFVLPIIRATYADNIDNNIFLKMFPAQISWEFETKTKTELEPFLSEERKKYVYEKASAIYKLSRGHRLIVLGQTPAYIGHMVNVMSKRSFQRVDVIYLPISGRPDMTQAPSHRKTGFKDLLSYSGDQFFRDLHLQLGFDPKKKDSRKFYLFDNSTGPSVAHYFLFLARWYRDLKIDLPDIHFISWEHKKTGLNLKIDHDIDFKVDTHFLGEVDDHITAFDTLKDNLRVLPPFNSSYWKKGACDLLKLYPRNNARELLKAYETYIVKKLNK